MTVVIDTIAALRSELDAVRASGRTVALVATLGALHAGHLSHVARARELADVVVVSIFVNPTQFGANEDLAKYPRDLDGDVAKLAPLDVDFVFAPAVEQMYPFGATEVTVHAGKVGTLFEGRARPGHFDGVLTVVAKLFNIVQPQVATFGQKDAQQLFLVRKMVADLNIPTRIETIATVREDDGLALSSRNRFLSSAERRAARTLSIALDAAQGSADHGVESALAAAQGALMGEQLVELDYVAIVHPRTFLPVDDGYTGPATAIVAAKLGTTRLIDNETIRLA
jgi:pantoate--beta-alanine ligase